MGQTVGAAACGSLMDLTYQPEASWAVSSGLGGHHGLQQERHHERLRCSRWVMTRAARSTEFMHA